MRQISIIGPNHSECSSELYDFGVKLGFHLSVPGQVIICGGMGGFMEAVCKGVKSSGNTFPGQTIGILPDDNAEKANPFIDIIIPTGLGIARNILIVNSADIIIAAGGGAGTLSELAFAWQKKKKTLCITVFGGWSQELAGKNLDGRANNLLIPVSTIEEILSYLNG